MEDTDANDSDALTQDEDRLADLEKRLRTHEKILRDFSIIGPGMSGNVREGWDHDIGPEATSSS
jgi:hypothetical protein